MKKILQINITANWGSHGKIAEGIGLKMLGTGWESHIAYGRWLTPSKSQLYRIGSMTDEYIHGAMSYLFDCHGLCSKRATKKLLRFIRQLNPDIIHLHNIHGYYLHYPLLFSFLREWKKPVVWTLHDCWPYTGHCAHYMYANCDKWKSECHHCPLLSNYPKCVLFDNSKRNYRLKRDAFLIPNLTLVPVSKWLEKELKSSFLADIPSRQIYNGIDTELFQPNSQHMAIREKYNIATDRQIVLGVASNWYRKGLPDFLRLAQILPANRYQVVMVGLKEKELQQVPASVVGIPRTGNVEELIQLYTTAAVLFNPTWEDNLPTTHLEAQACGTPVVSYDTGGCAETISPQVGTIVPRGNLLQALEAIEHAAELKPQNRDACRRFIIDNFNKEKNFGLYADLYSRLIKQGVPEN